VARLDTGWHAHPKILRLGWAAMGLHCWSISYSDYHRTDGFVPTGVWPALPGTPGAVKSLVTTGLWEPVAGGYMVHDYLDYNRSRADIEALEQSRRSAGQAGGAAKAQARALAKPLAKPLANARASPDGGSLALASKNVASASPKPPDSLALANHFATPRIPDPGLNSLAAAASLLPGTRDSTGSNARGPGRAHEAENDPEDKARARLAARRRADEKNNLANWRREQQAAAAKFSEVF